MSKNRGFAAGLADTLDPVDAPPEEAARPNRLGIGALTGRTNRLAELASGSVVSRAQELVDPGRCRMWAEHNRNYGLLNEERCADLIESLKAQNRQEVPAIVRRVQGDPDFDFEVICGARRHWAVSWLRAHTYPDFRYLVEIRELTDEEAFRLSDLENRARADLTDIERAADYLGALERHYGGRQKTMAQRLNVTESWLSRYLDLARLPQALVSAFASPGDLRIKHVTQLKPLLKPEARRDRVIAAAQAMAHRRADHEPAPAAVVIRRLAEAADAEPASPKKSGSPKRSGSPSVEVVRSGDGRPLLRVDGHGRKGLSVTLFPKGGGRREDVETALRALLEEHWT